VNENLAGKFTAKTTSIRSPLMSGQIHRHLPQEAQPRGDILAAKVEAGLAKVLAGAKTVSRLNTPVTAQNRAALGSS